MKPNNRDFFLILISLILLFLIPLFDFDIWYWVVFLSFLSIQLYGFVFIRKEHTTGKVNLLVVLYSLIPVSVFLSLFYSDDFQNGLVEALKFLPVALCPLMLWLNRSLLSEKMMLWWKNGLKVFVSVLVMYSVLSIVPTIFNSFDLENSHVYIRHALQETSGLHPTYFGLYVLIGAILVQSDWLKGAQRHNWFNFVAISIFLIGALVAASKMILALLFVTFAIFLFRKGGGKVFLVRSLVMLSCVGLLVVSVKPIRERFDYFFDAIATTGVEQENPDSLRKGIYESAFQVAKESTLLGVGVGDVQKSLNLEYSSRSLLIPLQENFNAHNQYLQFCLIGGIPLFGLFVLIEVLLIGVGIACKSKLILNLTLVLIGVSFSESIMEVPVGLLLFSVILPIIVWFEWKAFAGVLYINGRFKDQQLTGVQRFASETSARLMSSRVSSQMLVTSNGIESDGNVRLSGQGMVWEQVILPCYLFSIGSPLLLNLCNSAPLVYRNQVVTIHDVAFTKNKKWFSAQFRKWYGMLIPIVVRSARKVFTVSEFSKSEILQFCPVDPGKIVVVYNGIPSWGASVENAVPDGDYIVCVGTFSERKNQQLLAEAFCDAGIPNCKLIFVGNSEDRVYGKADDVKGYSENVEFKSNVNDNELRSLYENALFSVYISHYEGFGLPVLESLTLCTPVLVSDITVFRELFTDDVEYCDQNDKKSIMSSLLQMHGQASQLKQKVQGTKWSEKYSYDKSSQLMEHALVDLLYMKSEI